jgi:hypothetical protein
MRRIRLHASRPGAFSPRTFNKSGSLTPELTWTPTSKPTSTQLDKHFLNQPYCYASYFALSSSHGSLLSKKVISHFSPSRFETTSTRPSPLSSTAFEHRTSAIGQPYGPQGKSAGPPEIVSQTLD